MDSSGDLFITDTSNRRIRKVSSEGTVSTIAGTGRQGNLDGKAEEAEFGYCNGIAVGKEGTIYVSDYSQQVICKISGGFVTTLAGKSGERGMKDGKGEEARFNNPYGLCLDSDDSLLVVGNGNHRIRRVSMEGVVSTFAESGEEGQKDGDLNQAQFMIPVGICTNGEDVYVADCGTNSVRKISKGRVVSLNLVGPTGVTFLNGFLFTSQFRSGEESGYSCFSCFEEDTHNVKCGGYPRMSP